MKWAYYNEFDPYAAQWLRNLISAGHIANGAVDERSIVDVCHDDLFEFNQCHFFAGIGVWSHALRAAGWHDDREVWTGSCPCQPFSEAGKGDGFADERHLWPAFLHLIEQRRPPVVFGEQVEAAIRHGWLDLVQADMEGIGYAFAAAGIPAAGIGAPHIRQRLWFVADAEQRSDRCKEKSSDYRKPEADRSADRASGRGGAFGWLADNNGNGRDQTGQCFAETGNDGIVGNGATGGLADPIDGAGHRSEARAVVGLDAQGAGTVQAEHGHTGPTNGHWRDADWLFCRDGKWRPVEPGTFPLAHGAASRVGRLRAYGNAIVTQVAQEMITAYMGCRP